MCVCLLLSPDRIEYDIRQRKLNFNRGCGAEREIYSIYLYSYIYIHIYIYHMELRYGNETYFSRTFASNSVNSRNLEHILHVTILIEETQIVVELLQ